MRANLELAILLVLPTNLRILPFTLHLVNRPCQPTSECLCYERILN
jgi:hypothetical protein